MPGFATRESEVKQARVRADLISVFAWLWIVVGTLVALGILGFGPERVSRRGTEPWVELRIVWAVGSLMAAGFFSMILFAAASAVKLLAGRIEYLDEDDEFDDEGFDEDDDEGFDEDGE
jgi:hypothetical protein